MLTKKKDSFTKKREEKSKQVQEVKLPNPPKETLAECIINRLSTNPFFVDFLFVLFGRT